MFNTLHCRDSRRAILKYFYVGLKIWFLNVQTTQIENFILGYYSNVEHGPRAIYGRDNSISQDFYKVAKNKGIVPTDVNGIRHVRGVRNEKLLSRALSYDRPLTSRPIYYWLILEHSCSISCCCLALCTVVIQGQQTNRRPVLLLTKESFT